MLTVWKPRPELWERIKAREAWHEQPLTTPKVPAEEQQAHVDSDSLPARSQRGDEYLERYLRGEITPDMVIERLADLLNAFVNAQVPCIWEK
jgi:hypothetical protein